MSPAPAFPDLTHFFAPRSVALIGATEDSSKYAGRSMQIMLDFGFRGRIYPVNPKYRRVRGFDCYPSVKDLPEAPDHVSVVVPALAGEAIAVQRPGKASPSMTASSSWSVPL